jgi:uncharacterized protein
MTYYPLVCAILSLVLSQCIKCAHLMIVDRKIDIHKWFSSGGMPSSHSALVSGMTMAIGYKDGFASSIFSVSLVFSLIVLYDSAGVRQMVGQQAITLNSLIKAFSKTSGERISLVKEFLGHTPFEVIMGVLVGASLATIGRLLL